MAQEQKQNQNQSGNDEILKKVDEAILQKKLEEAEKKAEEYLNNWKQERADFINYKKDEVKRLEEFVKFGNEVIIMEILDIVDDLEIAVKHSGNGKNELEPIMKKISDWLKKYGVEKIKVEGEKFNPELHEAVEGSATDGEKVEEMRTGYTLHGRVIRPTRVKIING